MRERDRFPGGGGVTALTICSSLACMRILTRMTGVTGCGRTRKNTIDMTTCTSGVYMCPGEFEG